MKKDYHIFKLGDTPYLFAPEGPILTSKDTFEQQPTIRFDQMRLYSFTHGDQDIHIVAFSDVVTHIFGRNDDFIRFLLSKNVPSKTFKLKSLIVQEPVDKLKKLRAAFIDSDEHNLLVTASYLENWINITIKVGDKILFDYQGSQDRKSHQLPDLNALDKFPVSHKWSGYTDENHFPDEIYQYAQQLKKSEQNSNLAGVMGCLVILIIIGIIISAVFF